MGRGKKYTLFFSILLFIYIDISYVKGYYIKQYWEMSWKTFVKLNSHSTRSLENLYSFSISLLLNNLTPNIFPNLPCTVPFSHHSPSSAFTKIFFLVFHFAFYIKIKCWDHQGDCFSYTHFILFFFSCILFFTFIIL